MFGVGPLEMAFCVLIVLLVYGPDRLPTIARKAGRFFRDFKQISDAVTTAIRREMNHLEHMADEEEAKKQIPPASEPEKAKDVADTVSRD